MECSKRSWLSALVLVSLCCLANTTDISHDGRAIKINGERRIIISGAIHYPRSTPEMWPDLLRKAKEGGLDTIESYIFWNGHEPRRREYYFEGNYDVIRFFKEIQNAGLYAILRIGPYVCAEWDYGGVPAWLRKIPGMEFRTNNQQWKDEMANFTTLIVDMIKKERLFAPQGGPIILAQIENEYEFVMGTGDAGKEYIKWCAKFAESLNVGLPWIMCQQSDAPQPMINTCNGYYCDNFTPNNPNSPKFWTENWLGWFKAWGNPDRHRPAEDLAFAVARFYQSKGTLQNYYMYHGGTNFGRTPGGPYITTSYDYDAPLDEYGNIKQPKWGHLKELHAALKLMEKSLTYGEVNNTDFGNGAAATKFSYNATVSGCFLSNTNQYFDATLEYQGTKYFLPAWSVSILPDCKQEVYNTARVTTQTSIMVKKPNKADDEASDLKWSWRPETLGSSVRGLGGNFTENKLLEQITTAVDESDYLWYMTSVDITHKQEMTLRVSTTGHVLHAFVNGQLVGSQYGPNGNLAFVFERTAKFKAGKNHISLLSVTVGLQHIGVHYELDPAGIVGGPVQLIGGNITIDLSTNAWSYKIGLDGEKTKVYLDNPDRKWYSGMIPTQRPFTWYKTTFETPLGLDPVVVDLLGMGKGAAWVNGNSIGRFWPNYTASADGCNGCDYEGEYKAEEKCQTGCGEPSQRWYHVPRSFLKPGEPNTLVLFEEAGGDPAQVDFQTVTVGTACSTAEPGKTLNLSCQGGRTISNIDFASLGDPKGTCGSYQKGGCESDEVYSLISEECVGKESCSIQIGENLLGKGNCSNTSSKSLVVQATC
ncbi:beta-galactosidase 1-like isoform X2 [Elaeis guineensis]|uniref:beta-galactosidase 1-like isoform X2 n=1 Tax=Elaeis guineensis var. tenera TaxID=51953 RepID=UPI003C6D63F7